MHRQKRKGVLMGKVGKTFTCDVKVLLWLEEHAKKNKMKQSTLVNGMLRSAMRMHETWICPICGVSNDLKNISCYTLSDGDFCKGVKPK